MSKGTRMDDGMPTELSEKTGKAVAGRHPKQGRTSVWILAAITFTALFLVFYTPPFTDSLYSLFCERVEDATNRKLHRFSLNHVIHSNKDSVRRHFPVNSTEILSLKSRPYPKPNFGKIRKYGKEREYLEVPDYEDHDSVVALGALSYDAYFVPRDTEWVDVEGFQSSVSFGLDADGLRGHVFSSPETKTHIISFKGTTGEWLGIPAGPSGHRDKINDNLMFSCCCGHVDWSWPTYCGCAKGRSTCSETCLESALKGIDGGYYQDALQIAHSTRRLYPNDTIWVTGHSLGGSLAALVTLESEGDLAAFTYEAPGETLFAKRVGLTMPDDYSSVPIFHFGHNADPVFIGECKGLSSSCYFAGYALETRCHVGYKCLYDVFSAPPPSKEEKKSRWWWPFSTKTQQSVDADKDVTTDAKDNGIHDEYPDPRTRKWHIDIRNHEIKVVVPQVLKAWPGVPKCFPQNSDCKDCANWTFV